MTKLACVFPGQGSQSVGMLSELATQHQIVIDTFDRASTALGYDLWQLCQNGPEQELNQTQITQPALLTASYAAYLAYLKSSDRPDYMAGHSLGEYSALVAANVLSLESAVKLVELRGQLMQKAVPAGVGAMYAIIGLDDAAIQTICQSVAVETQQVVAPVNYNSPGQVVIAGHKDAVEMAATQLKDAGAKRALPLAVSVPSHCELMKGAAEELADTLNALPFSAPEVPVLNNVDVAICYEASDIKSALVRQLYKPVRWTECVEYLSSQGVSKMVEIGPGKVLSGLNKRINKSLELDNFS